MLLAVAVGATVILLGAPAAAAEGHSAPLWHRLLARQVSGAAATSAAQSCPDDGGVCRSVLVPLDRDQPDGAKIRIRYELFRHTNRSHPSLPPIFLTQGGPGASILNNEFAHGAWVGMLSALNGRHDIVAIDQRGVGQSGVIVCPALQQGIIDLFVAGHRCGQQLGTSSDLYGSSDVAADLDAVRRAIGASRIEFFGSSYSGVDIQSYAIRFPTRLRAAVLDSPVFPVALTTNEPDAVLSTAGQLCALSRSCSPAALHPTQQITWLARHLRSHPLDGVGIDDLGNAHHIHLTEGYLIWRILLSGEPFIGDSEVAASAVALRRGDSRPLLRLAAENDHPLSLADGQPADIFSAGDNDARFCTDTPWQWDEQASESVRRQQFAAFVRGLPDDAFAPFSVGGWEVPYPVGIGSTECIRWPKPTHDRAKAVPEGATFPSTPVIILSGSIDLTVPSGDARQVADEFPHSTFVRINGSAHDTTLNTHAACAQAIAIHFLRTLTPGDTSCGGERPDFIYPAVQAFPAKIAGERQARSRPGDGSTARDRKAVSSVWDAIRDTLWHQYVYGTYPEDTNGPGLRGGTFHIHYDTANFVTHLRLHDVRFTNDLRVSGSVIHDADDVIHADITLHGTVHGDLHLTGRWLDPRATAIGIRGNIDGRAITVSEPTN